MEYHWSLADSFYSHHVFVKTSHKEVQLAEVGPRFEMRREFSSANFHNASD